MKSAGRDRLPFLVAWDSVLRLVAVEARIRKRFKPGFVLDDNLLGLTTRTDRGTTVIYIQPDKFAQVAKAHRERPIAVAAYLHGIACHELTHADAGRTHANGHDERFIVAREDLGAATAHLLPALAVLVTKVLRLPEKDSDEAKRLGRLDRQVAELREGAKEAKRVLAAVTRERDRLSGELIAERRGAGSSVAAASSRAERLLEVAVGALRARPPAGVEVAYVEGFIGRNRGTLLGIVRGAFPGG